VLFNEAANIEDYTTSTGAEIQVRSMEGVNVKWEHRNTSIKTLYDT
jgi:hypothetical protein